MVTWTTQGSFTTTSDSVVKTSGTNWDSYAVSDTSYTSDATTVQFKSNDDGSQSSSGWCIGLNDGLPSPNGYDIYPSYLYLSNGTIVPQKSDGSTGTSATLSTTATYKITYDPDTATSTWYINDIQQDIETSVPSISSVNLAFSSYLPNLGVNSIVYSNGSTPPPPPGSTGLLLPPPIAVMRI